MSGSKVFVKVPKDRVGALIGPDGETKRYLEKAMSVELTIDSEAGDVMVTPTEKMDDPSSLFRAQEVLNAVGKGFSPEHASRLIRNEDAVLDVIDLRMVFGRSESDIKRVKGRVIGMNGKTRSLIEELTDTNLAVYGHTVSIIGEIEEVHIAREAVQMLVRGSMHGTVYRFLHRKRRELKKKKMELWEKPKDTV